jgi:uncharacterized protein (DUF58 family)
LSVAPTSRLRGYLVLVAAFLIAGLALGRVEPVVLAAPFGVTVLLGLALAERPRLDARVSLDRERLLEGEEVTIAIELQSGRSLAWVQLDLELPAGIEPVGWPAHEAIAVPAGGRAVERRVRCGRWGGYALGALTVTVRDPLGLFRMRARLTEGRPVRVYPRAEALRQALHPARTQTLAGNEVSRLKGEGIEFADIRQFVPGDRVRAINWRASARRQQLHVNQFHPERNADVIIFLDAFAEARHDGVSTLDLAVRGAAAIARHYLRRRDRVGLISFGGTLRWLRPGTGTLQLYRIVDSLLDTEIVLSYAWKGLEVIPSRILPPGSLVVGLTPLIDERTVVALLDLRRRGHDLSIVEVALEDFVRPGAREVERLAYRIWQLDRQALRFRYQSLAVPVAVWRPDQPLQGALEEVGSFRRYARLARV